jgi:ABC-type Na+ transport system ATPase subunit NatA
MPLLEMREAQVDAGVQPRVGPVTLSLPEGARLAHFCESAGEAAALAMLACGMLTATRGAVYVAAFDPRIQPVQVKRICGYVPYEPMQRSFASFEEYVSYRASLWGLPRARTIVRARAIFAQLAGMHEAFAYPLAGALLAQPLLVVLDRPQPAYAQQILRVTRGCAVFSTHTSQQNAAVFEQAAVPA